MKLSTRAKYGLKALIDLGLYSEKEAVSLQSIAGRQNISVSYLEQLMALLKKAGLVKSVRGAAGDTSLEDRQKRFQWEISFVSWRVAWRLQHVREQKVTVAARVPISAWLN